MQPALEPSPSHSAPPCPEASARGPAPREAHGDGAFLSAERERALLADYAAHRDPDALGELLRAHLPLVTRIARRHRLETIRQEDLIAEGMLGLLEAARRFEPTFGARFASYAAHWASAFIRRHALAHRRIVVLPDTRAARRVLGRAGRTEPQLASRLGRAPTEDSSRSPSASSPRSWRRSARPATPAT